MLSSPFPGMDPYLESRWPEVHARLIVYATNQVNQLLPNDLQASIEESLGVYADDDDPTSIRPDVNVSQHPLIAPSSQPEGTTALAEPALVRRAPHPSRHIEIVSSNGRIITAIEFISPWNKVGSKAREQYTRKQSAYMDAGVNLVEIDLVRQGAYVLAAPLSDIPETYQTPYMICVYRFIRPELFEIYRAPLQERLPNIPIPLRPHEHDIVLELQPLIDTCYRDGRYSRIDYKQDPKAKFSESDTTWLATHLKETGRR
jgi:hypothetical protein